MTTLVPVTVAVDPATVADPDTATASGPSELSESDVAANETNLLAPLFPAGMLIVNSLLFTPVPVAVKSVSGVAPLLSAAANVTVTAVALVNTDGEPANRAVTVMSSASPSSTASLLTDNKISSLSSSKINKLTLSIV